MNIKECGVEPSDDQWNQLLDALESNTTVTTVDAERTGMMNSAGKCIVLVLFRNTHMIITHLLVSWFLCIQSPW